MGQHLAHFLRDPRTVLYCFGSRLGGGDDSELGPVAYPLRNTGSMQA